MVRGGGEAVRDRSPLEESGMEASHWLRSMASHWLGCCWARRNHLCVSCSFGWVGSAGVARGQGQGPGHTPGLLSSFSQHHPTHPRGRTPARPVAGDAPRGSALSPISGGLRKCSSKGTHLACLQHPCPGPGLSPLQVAGGASTQASRPPGLLQCTSRLQGEAFKVSSPLLVPIS